MPAARATALRRLDPDPCLGLRPVRAQADARPHAYDARVLAHIPFAPLYNMAGNPAASLSLGWTENGLPLGEELAARFGDEATILRAASQIEATPPWRRRRPEPARIAAT